VGWKMSKATTVLCSREGNRRYDVALAMRHGLAVGLSGLSKEDERHPVRSMLPFNCC